MCFNLLQVCDEAEREMSPDRFMRREFPEIFNTKEKPQDVLFIPGTFFNGKTTEKVFFILQLSFTIKVSTYAFP